jgi:hypothetical protein
MIEIEDIHHERHFLDLLCDAVVLAQLSNDAAENDEAQFSLSRGSIMSSVFSLECVANCCIDYIPHGKQFKRDIDKLPFLSKFEVFLGLMFSDRKLDRGRSEVHDIQELKTIRDSLVHPKVKKYEIKKTSPTSGHWIVDDFPRLKIPRDITGWQAKDAIVTLKAINTFFNYYFIELCGFDAKTTCSLLISYDRVAVPSKVPIYISHIPTLIRANNEWGLDFRFMGFKKKTAKIKSGMDLP